MAIQVLLLKTTSWMICYVCLDLPWEMSMKVVENICLQDEPPIVLISTMEKNTFSNGYHVYKDTWIPKEGKQLEVFIEPDNLKDKFAVCFKVNKTNIRHLEKRSYAKICKKIFFSAVWTAFKFFYAYHWKKGVILGMERTCKSLVDWACLAKQTNIKILKQELIKMKEIINFL